MSKNKGKAPQAAATSNKSIKKINRQRRNASTRKCLSKSLKIQFSGSDRATFRALLAAEQESRKKGSSVST